MSWRYKYFTYIEHARLLGELKLMPLAKLNDKVQEGREYVEANPDNEMAKEKLEIIETEYQHQLEKRGKFTSEEAQIKMDVPAPRPTG